MKKVLKDLFNRVEENANVKDMYRGEVNDRDGLYVNVGHMDISQCRGDIPRIVIDICLNILDELLNEDELEDDSDFDDTDWDWMEEND